MIRSSAARSIQAGVPSAMLFLGRCLRRGGEPELRHQGGEVPGGKCRTRGLVSGGGRWTRCRGLQEGTEKLDREREDGGGVVLRRDLGNGLEIAKLNRARLLGEGTRRLRQRLRRLQLAL